MKRNRTEQNSHKNNISMFLFKFQIVRIRICYMNFLNLSNLKYDNEKPIR